MKPAGIFGVALVALALFACTQTTTTTTTTKPTTEGTPTDPKDGGATSATDAGKDSGSSSNDDKKDSGDDKPPGECASETSQETCIDCCVKKHESGSGTYFVALIDCICQEANCATACGATMCDPNNPQNPDAACNACMQQKNAACQQTVATACSADPDCLLFDKCVETSICTGK